jgi:hypothetical protein
MRLGIKRVSGADIGPPQWRGIKAVRVVQPGMTNLMKTLSISLLAAAALGLSVAHAQEPPRGGAPGDFAARRAEMQQHREAMQRQHAADLRTILRLRPDQEGALQAFLAASHPRMGGPGGMRHQRRDPGAAPETTPQRLDDMARRQAERGQMMEQRRQAVAAFYNALAPDQRAVFDALQRMHGPRFGGHGMHGGFGGHAMHGKGGPGR